MRRTMGEPGWIYVLINPSMEGLLKIGMTTRDPHGRAQELSGATGVPTPFIVAYCALVGDALGAEQFIHERLVEQRLTPNREFFTAPLSDVLKVARDAEEAFHPASGIPNGDDDPEAAVPWRCLLADGNAALFGIGDVLQDRTAARQCYEHAARLGSGEAALRLGNMARDDENFDEALAWYKDATGKAGGYPAWVSLGFLYWSALEPTEREALKQHDRAASYGADAKLLAEAYEHGLRGNTAHHANAMKCWERYFLGAGWGAENEHARIVQVATYAVFAVTRPVLPPEPRFMATLVQHAEAAQNYLATDDDPTYRRASAWLGTAVLGEPADVRRSRAWMTVGALIVIGCVVGVVLLSQKREAEATAQVKFVGHVAARPLHRYSHVIAGKRCKVYSVPRRGGNAEGHMARGEKFDAASHRPRGWVPVERGTANPYVWLSPKCKIKEIPR